jgi:hypothetical protein
MAAGIAVAFMLDIKKNDGEEVNKNDVEYKNYEERW